jgi:hypothetical protein
LLSACSAVAILTGCGGSKQQPPTRPALPSALAQRLAERADAVAASLDAGHPCGARTVAQRLQRETIGAIGRVPGVFQEPLQSTVNDLVARVRSACEALPPPAPPAAPASPPAGPPGKHERKKEEHGHQKGGKHKGGGQD